MTKQKKITLSGLDKLREVVHSEVPNTPLQEIKETKKKVTETQKLFHLHLIATVHKQLKIMNVNDQGSVKELINNALNEYYPDDNATPPEIDQELSNQEESKYSFHMEPSMHQRLKMIHVKTDISIKDLINRAVIAKYNLTV